MHPATGWESKWVLPVSWLRTPSHRARVDALPRIGRPFSVCVEAQYPRAYGIRRVSVRSAIVVRHA